MPLTTGLMRLGFQGLVKQDILSELLASARNLAECGAIHAQILHSEHRRNLFLHNLLIQAYSRCGCIDRAKQAFDSIPHPNTFSWNSLLLAFSQCGQIQLAKRTFDSCPRRNAVTWTILVQAREDVRNAADAFGRMPYRGIIPCNVMLGEYARLGQSSPAEAVFDSMPDRDIATWTCMIKIYGKLLEFYKAKLCFDTMPRRDHVAWNTLVSAYAQAGQLDESKGLVQKMPFCSTTTWNSLLAGISSKGCFDEVKRTVNLMPQRDVVTWSIVVQAHPTLEVFKLAEERNSTTWNTFIAANAQLGHLPEAAAAFNKMPCRDAIAHTAMLLALSQAGHLREGMELFNSMQERDVLSWNTIVAAVAHSGDTRSANFLVASMCQEGFSPDEATLTSLLVASGSRGVFDEFCRLFRSIERDFWIRPMQEHYLCAVDMVGRAGLLEEAESLIGKIPVSPSGVEWGALLGACSIHSHAAGGVRAAIHAATINQLDSSVYVLLGNTLSTCL